MKINNNSKEIILKKSEFLLHNNFKLIEITDANITFSNKKMLLSSVMKDMIM